MIKLYQRTGNTITAYHEAWENDGVITEHWGPLGETGESKEHPRKKGVSKAKQIESVLASARADGFVEFDEDHFAILQVEFAIEGHGTASDVDRIADLTDLLDEVLGWSGLGHCDGHSIGSGTMEACCLVVDFPVAKRVIESKLVGTPFADFTRIYAESLEA